MAYARVMTLRSLKRRVALLMDATEDDYQVGILRGISRAAEPNNVQLVCLAGGVIGNGTNDPRSRRNFLFDLVDVHRFEGIIALSGSLGTQLGVAGFAQFLQRYRGRPIVNLGVEVPGMHSISVAGAVGMRDVVRHLITRHRHRRIAFVRGPVSSEEAEQRYEAYRGALDEHGIAFDDRLVLQGSWQRESGAFAVRELLEQRLARAEAVTAIVCANDYMALGALDALAERGIAVPGDIAVTGFDDIDITRVAVPPLTTVRQPTEALGRDGLRRLVALMNGGEEPLTGELVAQLVERRSCGCAKLDAQQNARRSSGRGRSFEAAVVERRALICAELSRVAHGAFFGVGAGWEQRLLAALLNDLGAQGEASSFVVAIDQIVVKLRRTGGDLSVCQAVLGVLRREILECASDDREVMARAEDLFYSARDLLAESVLRAEISRKVDTLQQLREFSQTSCRLLGDFTESELREHFETRFRALGIPAFALGMFEEPGKVSEHCRTLAAYGSSRRFRVPETFRTSDFAPSDLFAQDSGTLLVQPLTYEGVPLGIATIMLSTLDISLFEQLREILGTALRGHQLARAQSSER